VIECYRTGNGLSFGDYGHDMCAGQSAMNKPMFLSLLGKEWLPAVPDVHRRLLDEDGARVADVGCGTGWSSIGMARAYPRITVDGFDLDAHSIAHAEENVREEGLATRITMHCADAATVDGAGRYDLVTAFECVHDLSRPVDVLRAMRRLVKPGGSVIVMDERVADEFDPAAGGFEWFFYGFSVLHCLPVGMDADDPAGTGTVMRTSTFTRYAKEAGFTDCQVLPIHHDLFRFYRLKP
jgi:SAM-dependent methyltransferase